MVVTTRVRLDRIASSTRNAGLTPEVIVGDQIVAAEGYLLAVRILEDKSTYNTVEDVDAVLAALADEGPSAGPASLVGLELARESVGGSGDDGPERRVVIEMRPDLAPKHVARAKQLAKQGFYDYR